MTPFAVIFRLAMLGLWLLGGVVAANPHSAGPDFTPVSTFAELKNALGDDAGARVRLMADIAIAPAEAADADIGIYLGAGRYTLDLNGHHLSYDVRASGRDPSGVPIGTHHARSFTLLGPGHLTGGTHALEQANQFGVLNVEGGTLTGLMGSGIRMLEIGGSARVAVVAGATVAITERLILAGGSIAAERGVFGAAWAARGGSVAA